MNENESIEFKENYTEKIYKEIIAFLNTNSGTIYIGYDDNGNLIGVDNCKDLEEKISNGIRTNIYPDARIFVSINTGKLEDKEYIIIKVSKGIDIYYLKEKGIVKGTYLRTGSCSIPATEETVKQLIIKNSSLSFETSISSNQELTFDYISKALEENNININENNIKENLHFTANQKYTNLGLLFSDQNPFTFKLAVYQSNEKNNFLDRKEFKGSILEIYDTIIDYLKNNTATYGLINTSVREDIEEYPEFILREIVLNSLIHRDYGTLTSNILNLYKNNGIEVISFGTLYGNITLDDILAGLSTSRNPYLQSIFMRIKRVEAIGSGLRRVKSYYNKIGLNFEIDVLPSSFVVKLPKISLNNVAIQNNSKGDMDIIIKYIEKNGSITRINAQALINKEKTTTSTILNKLVENGVLVKIGNGPSTRYEINK